MPERAPFPPIPDGASDPVVETWWCGDDTPYGCNCHQVQVTVAIPDGHPLIPKDAPMVRRVSIWEGTYDSADNPAPAGTLGREYDAACKHYGVQMDA